MSRLSEAASSSYFFLHIKTVSKNPNHKKASESHKDFLLGFQIWYNIITSFLNYDIVPLMFSFYKFIYLSHQRLWRHLWTIPINFYSNYNVPTLCLQVVKFLLFSNVFEKTKLWSTQSKTKSNVRSICSHCFSPFKRHNKFLLSKYTLGLHPSDLREDWWQVKFDS